MDAQVSSGHSIMAMVSRWQERFYTEWTYITMMNMMDVTYFSIATFNTKAKMH